MAQLRKTERTPTMDVSFRFLVLLAIFFSALGSLASEQKLPYLLVDTHIDAPIRAYYNDMNVLDGTNAGEFDLPRAQQGGLSTVFMSIYTPPSAKDDGTSNSLAHELIDWVEATASSSDSIGIATCTTDVRKLHAAGTLGFALGMENGSPLEGDVSKLGSFVDRGIRYITLAHGKSNEFSDSSYDENEPHGGLSDAGRELVSAMNAHGIIIDISHLTDDATWQVLELSENPVLATHSSLRHFIPDFHRNLPDELVVAVGENGGVVNINFGSSFVSNEARLWQTKRSEAMAARADAEEMTRDERIAFYAEYQDQNPFPFATVATVVDHIDRVVELTSVDHVGIGSDYDGVGDTLPVGLKDVSMFPNLIAELQERGYDDTELRKILGENVMRVWKANEVIAAMHGNPTTCTQT
ncbi:MAG: membrane dipeptidase [Gammaproteobacteria bacterium]|nr:membrane dipeptidase [Gammaproteobacteria bacterium]